MRETSPICVRLRAASVSTWIATSWRSQSSSMGCAGKPAGHHRLFAPACSSGDRPAFVLNGEAATLAHGVPDPPAPPAARHAGAAPPRRRDHAAPAPAGAADVRARRGPPSRAHRVDAGVVQHTRDSLRKAAVEAVTAGVGGLMLFGVPARSKDATGSAGVDPDGMLNVALRDVRSEVGDATVVMADTCLDEFTDHGHCGVLGDDGPVDNDATLRPLRARWRSRRPTRAAHLLGPSGMMDGQVGVIRAALDAAGHRDTGDPGLRGQVRLGVLRAVPRGRRDPAATATGGPTSRTRPTPRVAARGRARPRRGRRHRDGEARDGLSGRAARRRRGLGRCRSRRTRCRASTR